MAYLSSSPAARSQALLFTMEERFTWFVVGKRLTEKGRGAPHQLAQRLGMDASYFYRKLKGKGEPTESQARIVRQFLDDIPDDTPVDPSQSRRQIAVYGAPAAGEDLIRLDPGSEIDVLLLPMGLEVGPGDYFAVRQPGSSMEPRIFSGEHAVIRRGHPPAKDRDVLVEFVDGTATLKTYSGQRSGHVFVQQFDPPKTLSYEATKVRGLHAVAFKL